MTERVPEERVLEHWLATENVARTDPGDGDPTDDDGREDWGRTDPGDGGRTDLGDGNRTDPGSPSRAATLDALLSRKPGAASFVWRERPIRWYRLELDRAAFVDLRPVGGPDDLRWRELSTDGTLVGVARRLREADGPAAAREAGVDPDVIESCREAVAEGRDLPAIVVRTRRGRTPWYVADGNHRVTGRALHALETGEYVPQTAYVGVTANPVLGPLRDRALGLLDRLRGRSPARRR